MGASAGRPTFLSGTGSDGVLGLRAAKDEGGMVMAALVDRPGDEAPARPNATRVRTRRRRIS
jgi:hypothetical protein